MAERTVKELSETVQQYPALYNNRSKYLKDKNIENNCWKKVAKQLGFEESM